MLSGIEVRYREAGSGEPITSCCTDSEPAPAAGTECWKAWLAPHSDSIRDRLAELSQPLLVVTGGEDTWVPTDESVDLARGLPESELVVIPDCGHVSHEECPGSFLEAVSGWVVTRSLGG